ncbi:hypothetical protein NUW54_g6083 [Trametes sanguinea]|uniref:Uncharacterized protein n=1 Tax=Trametes sanguinea TaxID=158606 RepID=A0ACC1PTS3_9APHY|nr:hypothetical protein NUW54_g6083 [Trametes sanguinea]
MRTSQVFRHTPRLLLRPDPGACEYPLCSKGESLLGRRILARSDLQLNVGARNFLFINVPPTDRSPLMIRQGATAQALLKQTIAGYNAKLAARAASLQAANPGVQTWVWDSNAAFTTVLDDPTAYGFVDATSYGNPGDFWGNNLHPSSEYMVMLTVNSVPSNESDANISVDRTLVGSKSASSLGSGRGSGGSNKGKSERRVVTAIFAPVSSAAAHRPYLWTSLPMSLFRAPTLPRSLTKQRSLLIWNVLSHRSPISRILWVLQSSRSVIPTGR